MFLAVIGDSIVYKHLWFGGHLSKLYLVKSYKMNQVIHLASGLPEYLTMEA